MSDMEFKVGTLTPLDFKGSVQDFKRTLMKEGGIDVTSLEGDEDEDTWHEFAYKKYVEVDGKIYRNCPREGVSPYGCAIGELKDSGDISYVLHYYNGGCCFNEAVEEAVKDALK